MPRFPEGEPQPNTQEEGRSTQDEASEPKEEVKPSKPHPFAPKGESSTDLLARVYPVKSYLTNRHHST